MLDAVVGLLQVVADNRAMKFFFRIADRSESLDRRTDDYADYQSKLLIYRHSIVQYYGQYVLFLG